MFKLKKLFAHQSWINYLGYMRNLSFEASNNYYNILGVSNTATSKEIRDAFVEKSKELHPDSSPEGSDTHNDFVVINEAYKVLSKPLSRKMYDTGLPVSSNIFNRSRDEASPGTMADSTVVNPLRSKNFKNPYKAYDKAWKSADRWTDYHNSYGTSRAQRQMQKELDSEFWKEHWENSRTHGGGGPQFASHEINRKAFVVKTEIVVIICLLLGITSALTTLFILYAYDKDDPVSEFYRLSSVMLKFKMSSSYESSDK